MSLLFASTFLSGGQAMIRSVVERTLPKVSIERMEDGIVLYRTSATVEQVQALRFFQNTFAVITMLDDVSVDDAVIPIIKAVRDDAELEKSITAVVGKTKQSYRVIASVQNEPVAIPPLWKEKLEKIMSSVPFLSPGSANANLTFWVLARSEGFGFFGLRLTKREEAPLSKGELRPEIAHLMCALSNPKPSDIFLDPFAGSGAIPVARAKMSSYKKIIAGDKDLASVQLLKKKLPFAKNVELFSADVIALDGVADASVDAIVTDPPWGKYDTSVDLPVLYSGMLTAFRRVLKPGAHAVVLTSRDGVFETALQAAEGFRVMEAHDVLISGQKARIHLGQKI